MTMIRFNPFRELDSWFNAYNRSLANQGKENPLSADWKPSVDIVESDKSFLIKAELAGVPKDDIQVQIDKNILTISGERKSEITDEKHHRVETFYGSFSRSFSLPENVSEESIKAESKDGILYLTLPKHEPKEKLKKIEIH
ncbi:Hsp20/alpha crystallin family protein [Aliikangiella coralliicola]|uniref:Hsp20/alpha crystallin family protein n=1 Tax=Aliikangiella coralliicola TaxID=2592383 RepID=A0A545UH37_9GAMM|nr:Hsp20/alpha crystallin family protein [Aliikangiella coralliicola]TQV88775.1 Hsp20/alpha crystallin family protein [Aliikangiella coralliicola]